MALPRRRGSLSALLIRALTSARFYVYFFCTALALITTVHLGKEMWWDTLDYHLYAGFSAIHDRFGLDYFPAAWQAYLNPYVYAPFYLLATSGMTALEVALVLGAVQSGILWLTYEMAVTLGPRERPAARLAMAACAVAFAFANPVLVSEMGSSFADITTAEVVLAGWLLLLLAVKAPGAMRLVCAALLLGAATALKLTNAVHAVAAAPMVLFLPGTWRVKLRYCAIFALAAAAGFAVVTAPWSIRLEEHFGNPFFPLLNGIFRSPYFTTAPLVDDRFTPMSFGAALALPFTMVIPRSMVHVEWAAPDLRYALLLALGVFALSLGVWRLLRKGRVRGEPARQDPAARALWALGCGFLTDWILWETASANSRYFIPMACVAAVLGMALVFRLLAGHPKARNYLLMSVFAAQFIQLHTNTEWHDVRRWGNDPWFDLTVPVNLTSEPALYFSVGMQSHSFVLPYLAPGSGFINLEGIYTLDASGPNGRRIQALVRTYSPRLRLLLTDSRVDAAREPGVPDVSTVDDALEPFGLQADVHTCSKIIVHDIKTPLVVIKHLGATARARPPVAPDYNRYLASCPVVPYRSDTAGLFPGEHAANLALDHLEVACPALFQPRGIATYVRGDKDDGYAYRRYYPNTDVMAWVSHDSVEFEKVFPGGPEHYVGPENAWERQPFPVICRRTGGGDLLKVM